MKQFMKNESLLFYFIGSFLFMETTFRIITTEVLFTFDYVRSLTFLLAFCLVLFLVCSFFNGTFNFLLALLFLGMTSLIYASQIIYYTFFKTYYIIYSLGDAGQIMEFRRDIFNVLFDNIVFLILFFLPVIGLVIFKKKRITFVKIGWLNRLIVFCCIILFQFTGIATIYAGGKEAHSAYDLYYNSNLPILSVERFGILTAMRIDLQRMLVGWSPNVEVPNPANPVFSHKPTPERESITKMPPEKVEPKPIEYNKLVDFDELMANEANEEILNMHRYFNSVEPTAKNEYTGKYKGYNLNLIIAEGFSPYAVRKDVTPTLYKLVHEGFQFTNFYTPIWGVSTSDGEYVALNSLIPKSGVWSFRNSGSNHLPFVMGQQLKKQGYKTTAYHNHTYTYYGRDISHPNMGYDYFGLGNGLDVKETWPESDLEMIEKTIPNYIDNEPFHTYYMTVSGHMQYSFMGNFIANKNKQLVKDLPYSEQAKAYLATQIELDRALETLMAELEKKGIAERTLIALSADHYPYGLKKETIDELAGHIVEENFELYKSTFILYTKGMNPVVVKKPASSLDILPTLSNLLGLEYDSRLLMGRDIFSDAEPLVIFQNQSFVTNKGSYNSNTHEFTSDKGEDLEEGEFHSMLKRVQEKFYYSEKILELDYYRKVFQE
ncbi:sulfatase-like hydrolase/transferase [Bacillus sp. JJ1566]|uniref:LTA synthase family protein n=1 Tax=Bacillus sp. JJ1566 TaxID=3122961 RepID=UPI002FFFB592